MESTNPRCQLLRWMQEIFDGANAGIEADELRLLQAEKARLQGKREGGTATAKDTEKMSKVIERIRGVEALMAERRANGTLGAWRASLAARVRKKEVAAAKATVYIDWLVSTMNANGCSPASWMCGGGEHPCAVNMEPPWEPHRFEEYYASLQNRVGRHTRHSPYCERDGECRFGFPVPLVPVTTLDVVISDPLQFRPHIAIKVKEQRNDPLLNTCNPVQLVFWQANCDLQVRPIAAGPRSSVACVLGSLGWVGAICASVCVASAGDL